MIWKRSRTFAVSALAVLSVTATMLAFTGGSASAAVSCPTVDPITGTVSPAPAPGADWQGCDLANANLFVANLAGANLAGADLTGANLTAADLSNANLSAANLASTNLQGAFLNGAALTMVRSGGITGYPTTLPANWIIATSLAGGYLAGPGADFSGQNLPGINFNPGPGGAGADLAGADFAGATVREIGGDNLTGANFTGANLRGADFYGSDLTNADFSNADLTSGNLSVTTLTGTKLGTATLTGIAAWGLTGTPTSLPANWSLRDSCLIGPGAILPRASLTGANLSQTDLSGADLADAYMASSNLTGTNLSGADLAGADLTDANLTDVTLAGATITGATLTGAIWSNTICPNGTNSNKYVDGCLSKPDTTPPAVTVTGIRNHRRYVLGAVPVPGCRTTDDGALATPAKLSVTTKGAHRVGPFIATCSGAVDRAGNKQTAPVSASYAVMYGFSGYAAPRRGSTIARSSRRIKIRFRLTNASGHPIARKVAASLAARHKVRVTLAGPGIKPRTVRCRWNTAAAAFGCVIEIPLGVRTGKARRYIIAAAENVGTGFVIAPPVGKAVNPEVIHFK